MMCTVYKLNKQGDNKKPCHTPFSILNQSAVNSWKWKSLSLDKPCFVYSLISCWTSSCFQFRAIININKTAMNIHMQIFGWTCGSVSLGWIPRGRTLSWRQMHVTLLHIPLLCAMSTIKLMYFGRAAKFTLKGINSVAPVQMPPPNETNRNPNAVLLSFSLSGRRSGCCLVSWLLCDMERVLIVLLGPSGVRWRLSLISLMLRACSQLLSDCSQAKGTWTILKFHRNFYKRLNEKFGFYLKLVNLQLFGYFY